MMKFKRFLTVLAGFFILSWVCFNLSGEEGSRQVVPSCAIIPLHGEVDFTMASFTKRSTSLAKGEGVRTIIFDIDTFGGQVDSALDISQTITSLDSIHTVAYVSVKAISAGALIALSCNEVIMKENTTIGDCAPITITGESVKMLGEKFQSPLRAEFRKLAVHNGYPIELAESMVSSDIEVVKVIFQDGSYRYMSRTQYSELTPDEKKAVYNIQTIVEKGKLLTMSDREAMEFGFATKVVKNENELLQFLKINSGDVTRIELMWSEKLVRFLQKITPILVVIGLLALYTEIKVPGFGLPGITAILCFALIFGSKLMVGLATYTEILLFLIGVILLIIEIFVIPGFGIAGFAGIFLITLSLYLASQSFIIPRFPWQVLEAKKWAVQFGTSLIVFFLIALFIARFLPRSTMGRKIFLQATLADKRDISQPDYERFLGKTGVTLSMLRPTGKAIFDEEIVDVISDTAFIPKDIRVKVIRVEGKKLFVEELA